MDCGRCGRRSGFQVLAQAFIGGREAPCQGCQFRPDGDWRNLCASTGAERLLRSQGGVHAGEPALLARPINEKEGGRCDAA